MIWGSNVNYKFDMLCRVLPVLSAQGPNAATAEPRRSGCARRHMCGVVITSHYHPRDTGYSPFSMFMHMDGGLCDLYISQKNDCHLE